MKLPHGVIVSVSVKFPQTGGAVLSRVVFNLLWSGEKQEPGIPIVWSMGRRGVCKFPTSGQGIGLHICGRKTLQYSSYCSRHHQLCYYRPFRHLEPPRKDSTASAVPGITDHVVVDLLGERIA